MFNAFDGTNFEQRLQLFDAHRDRGQRARVLFTIDEFLTLFQQHYGFVEIDGRALVGLADSAAALARRLLGNDVDPYWLAEMTARGVDRGSGSADRRKAARLIRRLRRDARLLSIALRRTIDLPQHKPPIRQGQRTDPRTDDLVGYLRSAWNRGTGFYPALSSPESEFARVVLALASDPGWGAAGLPALTYRKLRDRITARTPFGPHTRWAREKRPAKKTSATSRAVRSKSRK